MASLKAQGFEETSSKSKLVYDFSNNSPTKNTTPTILSSPTKNATEPRPSSPHKPHPLQFVSPAISKAAAAGSPTKQQSPVKQVAARCVSPTKPHPLQFVSPQRNNYQANKVRIFILTVQFLYALCVRFARQPNPHPASPQDLGLTKRRMRRTMNPKSGERKRPFK